MLDIILRQAESELSGLLDYYETQSRYIFDGITKEKERFKYCIPLAKYLSSKLNAHNGDNNSAANVELNPSERGLINSILEDDRVVSLSETEPRVMFRLKQGVKEQLGDKYELDPAKGLEKYIRLIKRPIIHGRTTLMMLLVEYEEIIKELFGYLIKKYPSPYLTERTITYNQIMNLECSVDDITQAFINLEIEQIMHQSLSEWYRVLNTNHKVNTTFEDDEFNKFKEVYYRRNILVHNNGIVNNCYICNVAEQVRENIVLGQPLGVDSAYIKNAIMLTRKIIYETIWALRKTAEDKGELLDEFFEIGFAHMLEGRWELSKFIFKRLYENDEGNEHANLCNKINYWISIKNLGGFVSIRADLERLDVTALSSTFKVARAALLDLHDQVSIELETAIGNELRADHIKSWPLFIQYRNSTEYAQFKAKHQAAFEEQEFERPVDEEQISSEPSCEIA